MADKYIIGDSKKKDKKEEKVDPVLYEVDKPQILSVVPEKETEQIPVDEDVWGNDHSLINKLTKEQLADRRLFVRIRHMQMAPCTMILDNVDDEPVLLNEPLFFMISDLSMGGIGIISDHKVDIGKILVLQLVLDNILYNVKCEVIYCLKNDEKYRLGIKIIQKDKPFLNHLKIFIARISLTAAYR